MTMQAYHNDLAFKHRMLARAEWHRIQDEYHAGVYATTEEDGSFRGCSVGCCIRDVNVIRGTSGCDGDHVFLAEQLGVPTFITKLQDVIFEGLPESKRPSWTGRLLQAIRAGADLDPILPRFLLKTVERLPQTDAPAVIAAIEEAKRHLQEWNDTGIFDAAAGKALAVAAATAAKVPWAAETPWAAQEAAWTAWAAALTAVGDRVEVIKLETAAWAAGMRARESGVAWARIADDLIEAISSVR